MQQSDRFSIIPMNSPHKGVLKKSTTFPRRFVGGRWLISLFKQYCMWMRLITRGNKDWDHSGYFSEIISDADITFNFIEIFFPFIVSIY